MTQIAVLGTGRMGAAITRRLLSRGHEVTVWNRTEERMKPLVAAGAKAASAPADVDADVVITMLTDAAAVRDVVAATSLRPGTVLVEMSTIGPEAVRELRVPEGVDLVDAPVLGSVGAAEAGQLNILAGGAVDHARPVLEALGEVHDCGPLGSGAALKLVANTALGTGLAALAETVAVARAANVDIDTALSVLAHGALGGAVRRAQQPDAAFPISLAVKDLDLALGLVSSPFVEAAAAVLRAAPDQSADLGTVVGA
ncbi:NAD(P)-dependent oxidoreductase [Actinoplanes friuliensis]|nr:NAD(P)-dependent oxidoreductase [Actinoplanes friuliensis]